MDYTLLVGNDSEIRKQRNMFIVLFSIIPNNIGISTMIGNVWALLRTASDENSSAIALFLEFFIIALISLLLEFVLYRILTKMTGRDNLRLYNICLTIFHCVLVYVILSVWLMLM